MKKMNEKGFTLIELLVVMAIIAILAGIVLVSLGSARERSRKASLQSTLSSLVPVASMCVNDGGTISAAVVGTQICSLTDIIEKWPALTHITGASYVYEAIGGTPLAPTISAGDGTNTIVTCTVATGSCILVP